MTQAEKECINKLRADGLGAVRIAYPIFNKYTQYYTLKLFMFNIKVVYLQKKYNLKNNNNGRKEF